MQKRSVPQAWRAALVAAALIAAVMALYVQIFERISAPEEDRLLASRLADALEESRTRLKREILAELRAELAQGAGQEGDRPVPGAVLRRSESAEGRALQQVLASEGSEEAALLAEHLDSLERRMDQTDRTVRRDLEEIRAAVRRERNAARKISSLLLAALLALAAYAVVSLLAEGRRPLPAPTLQAPRNEPGQPP